MLNVELRKVEMGPILEWGADGENGPLGSSSEAGAGSFPISYFLFLFFDGINGIYTDFDEFVKYTGINTVFWGF